MTEFIQAGLLAFIQGATEYLPISSSAHLIILPHVLSWKDQGLAFDIAVHVGTLAASVWYFRSDLLQIATAWLQSLAGRQSTKQSDLAWFIIIASIPVAISGMLLSDWVQNELRNVDVIAAATVLFALALWISDRFFRGKRSVGDLQWRDALLIGLGQSLAVIPGVSRSGIAITVGLLLGLDRKNASRFAFLLAIPVIAMAGVWQFYQWMQADRQIQWLVFVLAAAVSAAVAYLCIHYFLKFIDNIGMLPFVLYRLALGLMLFALA